MLATALLLPLLLPALPRRGLPLGWGAEMRYVLVPARGS
jgi:hypothetical protein